MTDKQIIIDCVNVSEWTDGEVYYKLEHYSPKATKQIAFDLYKQLKAKEQECERLKEEIRLIHDDCKGCDTCFNALESARIYCVENQKLKQTLVEIKEIAENCCINQATLDCENYDDCTQCGRISDGEGIQQILQKISECEEQ